MKEITELADTANISVKEVESRIEELHEQNPMLGHRGCRLAISFPEIYEMQCRAIFEALYELKKNKIKSAFPEIMIPLVSTEAEIKIMKDLVKRVANTVQNENKLKIDFMVGTMIELPRAAVKAKEIAKHADFFSFGTNDLTQTTFGISRDDRAFCSKVGLNYVSCSPFRVPIARLAAAQAELKK